MSIKKLLSFVIFSFVFFVLFSVVSANQNTIGTVTASVLNLRSESNTDAQILDRLEQGTQVFVSEYNDGWYKIEYGNIVGWVHGDYLVLEGTTRISGVVTGYDVNFRTEPNLNCEIITRVNSGDALSVLECKGKWYKVQVVDGTIGFIYKDYVLMGASSRKNYMGFKIINYAKKFLGVRYVYGGMSPNAFDCSGFVKYTLRNFGIYVPRVAADQAKVGVRVAIDSLRPGDLIFFDTNGGSNYINHVGFYIGNGQFIHASSSRGKISINDLFTGFYRGAYMTSRRVVR